MTAIEKIKEYIEVNNQVEFLYQLDNLPLEFFQIEFSKSKDQYLHDIDALLKQIDNYSYSVDHADLAKLRLKWNISILTAHLKLISKQLPEVVNSVSFTSVKVG